MCTYHKKYHQINPTTVPATPMAPHLPAAQQIPTQHPGSHPPAPAIHVWTTPTSGLTTCPNPPHQGTIILTTKRTQLCYHPQIPPIEAYITATEQASSNLIPSQCRALTQLKQDNSRVVLTADKGVAMVIMDQEDYTNKVLTLLQDTNTYKVLPKDPTSQIKNKLISLLKDIKQTGGLTTNKCKQLYPPVQFPPNSMACPKFKKQVHPLGPLFPVGGPPMVLPRSLHTSSNPL